MFLNPFNPNYPADIRYFANRKRELAWFEEGVIPSLHPSSSGPWNIAILGPWGIGKTSLANRFMHSCRQAPFDIFPVFISCSRGYDSLYGFFSMLVSFVADELSKHKGWSEKAMEQLRDWQLSIHALGLTVTKRQRPDMATAGAADILRRQLRDLWERFLADRECGILLILDDAHLLLSLDKQAFLILRAVIQDLHLLGARYGLVITGPSELFEDIRLESEPVVRFFNKMNLKPFDREDLADAIRYPVERVQAGITIPDETLDWIQSKTNGHPYFVTFIMRVMLMNAHSERRVNLDVSYCESKWPEILRLIYAERFDVDWSSVPPGERMILRQIAAAAPGDCPAKDVQNSGLLSRLVQKNLVIRKGRGMYTLYHPLFGEYIQQVDFED